MMRFFDASEFVCDGVEVYGNMDRNFLLKLDLLRERVGKPFHINSSFRTAEYNKKIGGAKGSFHVKGLAVDVKCTDAVTRAEIISQALDMGLSVGVYSTFLHIDGRNYNTPIVFHGKY